MNTLKKWLTVATDAEKDRLVELAGTKRSYLWFLSNPLKQYGRRASAEMAARLEAASNIVRADNSTLPHLLRIDLAPVCRACIFAQRCLGDAAIASEFDYIADDEEIET